MYFPHRRAQVRFLGHLHVKRIMGVWPGKRQIQAEQTTMSQKNLFVYLTYFSPTHLGKLIVGGLWMNVG